MLEKRRTALTGFSASSVTPTLMKANSLSTSQKYIMPITSLVHHVALNSVLMLGKRMAIFTASDASIKWGFRFVVLVGKRLLTILNLGILLIASLQLDFHSVAWFGSWHLFTRFYSLFHQRGLIKYAAKRLFFTLFTLPLAL